MAQLGPDNPIYRGQTKAPMDDSEVALATLGVIANSDAIHDRNPHRSQATKLAQIATAKNWRQNWRQTPNAKQPRQAKHLTGLSIHGARDQIRTGVRVACGSYESLAHRSRFALKLACS